METTFKEEMASFELAWSEENQRWERRLSKFKFDNKIAGVLTTTFVAKPTTDHQYDTWIERHSSIQGLMPRSLERTIPEDDLFNYLRKRFDPVLGYFNYSPIYDKRGNHYPATYEE